MHAFDADVVAFGDAHGDDVGLGVLAHHGDAMGAIAQRAESGDVIGVQMRVHGFHQPEIELAHELQVALDALEDRIDDQRFSAPPAGEEIGVGARGAVEELAEDHARLLMRPRRPQCGGSEDRTERYAVDAVLQPSGLKTRWLDGGNFASFAAGRIGRRTNSPPQFGQRPLSRPSAQSRQNVHSNEQITALCESGGRSRSQHSQLGLSASMVASRRAGGC